jgi:hypothetical protein
MAKTLSAHEQPIARIFSDDYVFRIPGYQRPYAWTTEQARELFEDLYGFMHDNNGEVADMPPYFLGSIVLIKPESLPDADVVDGQQRLTTLTLLLAAIRSTVAPVHGADITPFLYEKGNAIKNTQDRFRLTLRERDNEFFQRYVQREDGLDALVQLKDTLSDSQQNLKANAALFLGRLGDVQTDERLRLAQFIVTRCFLVVVATPDLDSAYRIFSVLNSRGLDLSATDILKAEIIGGLPDAKKAPYTAKWEDIEESLGRDDFGELFSHIRMVYRKAKPKGTLIKEFKDHVVEVPNAASFIDRVLVPMAEVFEEIETAEFASTELAEEVNDSFRWLGRLEFKDWLPPALAFAVRNRQKPAAMRRFFADLERLAYTMLVRRQGINERIERFSALTARVESGLDLFCEASTLQLSPKEKRSTSSVLDGPIYTSLAARARSLVLLRLDALLSGGGASYDFSSVTVEHVLPQTPADPSQWLTWFPDPNERAFWVNRVGNLALLTRKKNSSAGNYEFDTKKNAYFTKGGVSPFALTTQVLQHQAWTLDVVNNRQRQILETFSNHWRLS